MITIVYLITNTATGKRYVGVTRRGLKRRWSEHLRAARTGINTALYSAIRKYSEAVFTIEQLASVVNKDDVAVVERALIEQQKTKAPFGYNLTDGGDGVIGLPDEIVKRTAEKNVGRKHSPEALEKIRVAGRLRKQSDETKSKMRAAHSGKTLSAEHRAKLSASKLGKKLPPRTAEHSEKIAAGLRAAHARKKVDNE